MALRRENTNWSLLAVVCQRQVGGIRYETDYLHRKLRYNRYILSVIALFMCIHMYCYTLNENLVYG